MVAEGDLPEDVGDEEDDDDDDDDELGVGVDGGPWSGRDMWI